MTANTNGEAKECIALQFLEFLSRWVALPQARLATLGGLGVEAKVWLGAGIPPEHGSLIEIESGLARTLIKNYPYRTHDRLGAFHHIIANYGETVDGFHLDLCGTVGADIASDFAPTLPFILRSTGRCIAITVADARRNHALEHWSVTLSKGKELFGRNTALDLYRELVATQRQIPVRRHPDLPAHFNKGFDPVKGAKREFGLLTGMTELLCRHKSTLNAMERYVYVSRYHDRPFRMRTYFLHFSEGGSRDPEVALARRWIESPLHFLDHGEFVQVNGSAKPNPQPKEHFGMSKLVQLVALAGDDVRQEFAGYVADRERLKQILAAIGGQNGTAKKTTNGNGAEHPKKNWTELSPKEQLEFRLKVCKTRVAHMEGGGSYSTWCKDILPGLIKGELGRLPRGATKSIGAMTARMCGKHRSQFIVQVKEVLEPDAARAYIQEVEALPKEMPK